MIGKGNDWSVSSIYLFWDRFAGFVFVYREIAVPAVIN